MDLRELVRAGGLLTAGQSSAGMPREQGSPGEQVSLAEQGSTATRSVVVMLSGGRDSVCLLDVAVSLCGPQRVRALHVNYHLREEAEEDQRHCEQLCRDLGVALEVVTPARGPGNVQAWARQVRYQAALELAGQQDGLVAVGHTATDQVETILYRLAASPGRRALLGMPASEGRIVRPLLAFTREQTAAHCTSRGLSWREDASNDSDTYARGRVRAGLVPALRAVHPAAEANVLRTAELLREETQLLDELVDRELTLAGERTHSVAGVAGGEVTDASVPLGQSGSNASISIERLAQLHPALARLLLIRLAEQAAGPGAYVPQAGDRVGEILDLAARKGRAELHIGGLVSAQIEAGRLRMVAIAAHFPSPKDN